MSERQTNDVPYGITFRVIQEKALYSRFFAIAYGLLELAEAMRALAGARPSNDSKGEDQ